MLTVRSRVVNLVRKCTIFALSSGSLPSAIAIIRISGEHSLICLKKLTKAQKIMPRKLLYANFWERNGELIDRGMAVYLPGPQTSTGEDTVELYVHGSRAVIDCFFDNLGRFQNVRAAKAGEFTKRAFFNGKMSLDEVNSLSHLLNAETQRQRRFALRPNILSVELRGIRSELIELRAILEASVDFGDDVDYDADAVETKMQSLLRKLHDVEKRMKRGTLINDGISVVIVGRTNVGKSSLLNKIAERDVAIVSGIDGTTRDVLEVRIRLASVPITIADTAGIRLTTDPIEAEGVSRALSRARSSDILLLVIDASATADIEKEVRRLITECGLNDEIPILIVCNKCDLLKILPTSISMQWPIVYTSCATGQGLDQMLNLISRHVELLCPVGDDGALLNDRRHRDAIAAAIQCMQKDCTNIPACVMFELITAKQNFRRSMISLLKQLNRSDIAVQSNKVSAKVIASEWYKQCRRLTVYVSRADEIDTNAIIEHGLANGKEVFIPFFNSDSPIMDMIRLRNFDEYKTLGATLWGIRLHENPNPSQSWKQIGPLDVALIPGVAFTKDGKRLGHGRGFYDRFLDEHEQLHGSMPYRVGLALSCQMVTELPTTKYDIPLNCVIVDSDKQEQQQ